MARYLLHNILLIVILCVAILFISGIALPKFFSKQYFELRSELNEHSIELSSILSSIPVSEAIGDIKNGTQNISTVGEMNSTDFDRPKPTRKRSKREAPYGNGKMFSWKLNLNLSQYENVTDPMPLLTDKNYAQRLSTKDKNYLGMAIYMEGSGPKRTVRELDSAWNSVGNFIRSIFRSDVGRLRPQIEVNDDKAISINGLIKRDPHIEITQNPNIIEFNNEGSGEEPKIKQRGGRFIFGFLGFGSKPLTTTEFSINGEIINTTLPSAFSDTTQTDKIFRNDDSNDMDFKKSELFTELIKGEIGFQSDSLVFKQNHSVVYDFTEIPVEIPSESSNNIVDVPFPSKSNVLENDECDDCQIDVFEVPTGVENSADVSFGSKSNVRETHECNDCQIDVFEVSTGVNTEDIRDTTFQRNGVFSDETLEKFCMNLVNQLEESLRIVPSITNDSATQDMTNPTYNLNTILSLLLALEENTSISDPDIIEDSFFVSSDSPANTISSDRKSRFFNFNLFGLGSGRSALDDIGDIFPEEDIAEPKILSLPSVLDCKSYFRNKQNMFPKPNLMDMIYDPNIKLTDFSNATISIKLRDQQMQFLDNLLNSLSNSSVKSDINERNMQNAALGSENVPSENTDFSMVHIESSFKQNVGKHEFGTITINSNKIESSENSNNEVPTTETQINGRFFGIFGGGSGGGSHSVAPVQTDERFFIGNFFGSGVGRLVNESDVNVSENLNDLQESFSGDSFSLVLTETDGFNATYSNQGGRIFSFLGFGSGDGRQLNEDQTEIARLTEGHENDCSSDVAELSHSCRDDESFEILNSSVSTIESSTGSGGGNFMEDDGPINLIEAGTERPSGGPSRRGRLLDDLSFVGFRTEIEESSVKNSNNSSSSFVFPRRKGRLNSFPDQENADAEMRKNTPVGGVPDIKVGKGNRTAFDSFGDTQTGKMLSVDVPSSTVRSSKVSDTSTFKVATFQVSVCNSASECNAELNERCVRKGPSLVCDCRKPLGRHKESGKCIVKVSLDVSLKFPKEEFNEDLGDPESPRFSRKRKNSLDTMLMLLKDTPQLIPIIAEVDVIGFKPGSLIVSWNLLLAAENESESDLLKIVEANLKKSLVEDSLIQTSPLDIRNASVLSISSSLDPCMTSKMNYCSENAHCLRNKAFPGGYVCRCKDGHFDVSKRSSNKMYPGEVCEAFCPPKYCGDNGFCEFTEDEGRRCLCRGWYFGDLCEISGVVVVATFSASLGLIVLVVFLVVVCRGRFRNRRTYGGTQMFQRSEEVGIHARGSGRVSDVIAMEENVGARVAKFVNISTPLPDNPPTIKVTRPTLNESSISFDYDSTFDVTPSSDVTLPQGRPSQIFEVPRTT